MHSTLFFFIATIVATFHGAQAVCNPPDDTAPQWETTDGSPLIDDRKVAIDQLGTDNRCLNTNQFGSMYTTDTRHGTCKIDAWRHWRDLWTLRRRRLFWLPLKYSRPLR
ncbi:hypothetical protein Moror_2359 [Moniliophthora roreri MCA 2997]|uniref:Secreted protein n=1 Tax=Moniliophthora roreri (strain MCA 2997) TaxID=1381753 RepID=V2WG85_MONRO|nr:hypothetical protein Moror_2359 [Moniliophthora roreri MCA 2997]